MENCFVIGQTAVFVAGLSGKLFHAVAVIDHGKLHLVFGVYQGNMNKIRGCNYRVNLSLNSIIILFNNGDLRAQNFLFAL